MKGKDFVSISDAGPEELQALVEAAVRLKNGPRAAQSGVFAGKVLALLFEKPSLRTRVSFEVAMEQLGGRAIPLGPEEVQMGRRESVSDVARTLSRFVDGIVARTFAHSTVEELAAHATVPVINGLSDLSHPCQALGDVLTIYEKKGSCRGLTLAYIGDGGSNVAHSLLLSAAQLGMHMRVACPSEHGPRPAYWERARALAQASGSRLAVGLPPAEAVQGADIIYTDVWVSMGQESDREERRARLASYQVNEHLLIEASQGAIVMHPLPAHRGEEITSAVLDGPQSVVFDQAENRLHAQKALLLDLLGRGEMEGRR
ncbi:MAG: ornithine carbamoyltransferase [Chloroflexi bacterium]|nr:ornithine carbamoyltransferase [Chloroflexota bacterium]